MSTKPVPLPPEGSDDALISDNWLKIARFKRRHDRDPTSDELDRLRRGEPLDPDEP